MNDTGGELISYTQTDILVISAHEVSSNSLAGTNQQGLTFTKACTASARSDRTAVGGQRAAVESSRARSEVWE